MESPWLLLSDRNVLDFQDAGLLISTFLNKRLGVNVEVTADPEVLDSSDLNKFQGLVIYAQGPAFTKEIYQALYKFTAELGRPAIFINCPALFEDVEGAFKLSGARFQERPIIDDYLIEVNQTAGDAAWITERFPNFEVTDEPIGIQLVCDAHTFAHFTYQGQRYPAALGRQLGKGKMFFLNFGRGEDTWTQLEFQKLLTRGAKWAAGTLPPKPIGCAVIGYGGSFNMGRNHLELMAAQPGYKPTAICDSDPDRQAQAKKDFPDLKIIGSIQELIKMDEVELVTCITPHFNHHEIGSELLNAGKHVVVEKPFATTVQGCTQMMDVAAKQRVKLTCYHNRRYDSDFITLRHLIDSGCIGTPFQLEAARGNYRRPKTWWRSDKQVSGGRHFEWGVHFIDWITHLLPGRIEYVTGHLQKRVWHHVTNEDHAFFKMKFSSGAIATFEDSAIAAAPKPKFRILGENGALVLNKGADHILVYGEVGGLMGKGMKVPLQKSSNRFYAMLADHILLDEQLEITAEEARRNIAILEAAERSSKEGGQSVSVAFEALVAEENNGA